MIAAIERNGGVITTAYYDTNCLFALNDTEQFLSRGIVILDYLIMFCTYIILIICLITKYLCDLGDPIPRRLLPPADCLEYYSNAASRGYLADPEKISQERLILSQKYGYVLPKIEDDPDYEMLTERKDPRQLFYGLEPGWVISTVDKAILKPKAEYLKEFYAS